MVRTDTESAPSRMGLRAREFVALSHLRITVLHRDIDGVLITRIFGRGSDRSPV